MYKEGQTLVLRTRVERHTNGRYVRYYPHWDGLTSGESTREVTLTRYEAECLERGRSFYRPFD